MKRNYLHVTMTLGMVLSLTLGFNAYNAQAASDRQTDIKQNLSNNPQLTNNNKQQDVVVKRIKAIEKRIETLQKNVMDKQSKLDESQEKSRWLNKEINRLTRQINAREKLLKKRLRSIYINGGAISYLDVLLGAESFGNFLDRLFALKVIYENDQKLLTAQENDKKHQVFKRISLIKEQRKLQNGLADLRKLERDLFNEKEDQRRELALLRKEASKIKEKEMNKKEETEIAKAQTSEVNKQMPSIEIKKLSVSRSVFINPTKGYISSGFGKRSFDNSFHPGIDIANIDGTPVKASADGVVFKAYKSSSYGNTVILSHRINGKLYTTVYAHLNAYNVSAGERVAQGQVIGGMGNTGESFGSHLHFELYIGPWTPPPHKGAVNPVNYIQ
ncbi:peptidoglycan DD-metalloendopeptidase family protein [Sporolactobacillus sp. Y61]|uniref:Peptidoglycan DD-metalloendopeptidase family protein n=1 Tax=Sporolactobacillus sp. Y61 TaxID=3160863 RepID=A0AAU8IGJ1_9BACL